MLTLNINPCPKPRMTQSDKWNDRPPVVKYRIFRDQINALAKQNGLKVGNIIEDLTFVLKMPKSWSKKKKMFQCGEPHKVRPDLDNLLKAFKDALLVEDSNVHTYLKICKVWGYRGAIIIKT